MTNDFSGFSDLDLARMIVDSNDPDAALALFRRYEPIARSISRMSPEDRHAVYDSEDAYQDCFLALYDAVAAFVEKPQFGFPRHFKYAAGDAVRHAKNRARGVVVVPLTLYKRVMNAVERCGGDELEAREWLATEAPAQQRVDRTTFDSVWLWCFGSHLEWSQAASTSDEGDSSTTVEGQVPDTRSSASFQSVEDRQAVEQLVSTLPETWREVIVRLYGLQGHGEHTSQAVASVLGLHPVAVRKIHRKALARLQVHSDLPAHYTPADTSRRTRLASTVGGNRQRRVSYDFPVTVRRVSDVD